jgi:hypothetical protein
MMALSTSFTNSCQYYQKPEVVITDGAGEQSMILAPSSGKIAAGDSCYVVDLAHYDSKSDDAQLIHGLGYDWQVMQLGTASYTLPRINTDSISVVVYTVPFWPVYAGRSNAINISIDGRQPQVFENTFREYDRTWKDQVMRNGAVCRLRFAIDSTRQQHTISFSSVEHGQMLQRVIIDWGGLKDSYIGPNI